MVWLRVFHVWIALVVLHCVLDRHIRGEFDPLHSNRRKYADLPSTDLFIEDLAGKDGAFPAGGPTRDGSV